MWLGANRIAETVRSRERLVIPLNRNIADGIMESESARNKLLFLKQKIQIAQYNAARTESTARYAAKIFSD